MPSSDGSWVPAYPDVAATAARLLDIDLDTVRANSYFFDGIAHVWTPGRGGMQAVVDVDGGAYVRESCFPAIAMRTALAGGHRVDVSRLPLNHAASAVASALAVLRGEAVRYATPTGPTQAELEELAGAPLVETSADVIAERLIAAGSDTFALVGVDRAVGPGHWYVAWHVGDGQVTALDPIANTRRSWPPEYADASAWWVDERVLSGTPERLALAEQESGVAESGNGPQPSSPSEIRTFDATARGTRIFVTAPSDLERWARHLVKNWSEQPAERLVHGSSLWLGFWWTFIQAVGDGFRIAFTDMESADPSASTWDATAALDLYGKQFALTQSVGAEFTPSTKQTSTVSVRGSLDADELTLRRESPEGADSGWRIVGGGPGVTELTGRELFQQRPDLVAVLSLPVGYEVRFTRDGGAESIWNEHGSLVRRPEGPGAPRADAPQADAPQAESLLVQAQRIGEDILTRADELPPEVVDLVTNSFIAPITSSGPIRFEQFERVDAVDPVTIERVAAIPGFPGVIADLWREQGTGFVGADGFLRLIDPDRYDLGDSLTDIAGAVPFLATGMGDLLVWQDGVVRHVLYRIGRIENLAVTDLVTSWEDDDYLDRVLLRSPYQVALARLGRPDLYEAFFYAPFPVLGGSQHPDNLHRGDLNVSLALFTSLVGKASIVPGQPPSDR